MAGATRVQGCGLRGRTLFSWRRCVPPSRRCCLQEQRSWRQGVAVRCRPPPVLSGGGRRASAGSPQESTARRGRRNAILAAPPGGRQAPAAPPRGARRAGTDARESTEWRLLRRRRPDRDPSWRKPARSRSPREGRARPFWTAGPRLFRGGQARHVGPAALRRRPWSGAVLAPRGTAGGSSAARGGGCASCAPRRRNPIHHRTAVAATGGDNRKNQRRMLMVSASISSVVVSTRVLAV